MEFLNTMKQLPSDIERKEWFTNNRATIIPLLADLATNDSDHFNVILEDIIDLFPRGNKGKMRQEIKFHVKATQNKRVNELRANHFSEEVNLEKDDKGNIRATIVNIAIILLKSKHLLLKYDEFTGLIYYEVYGQYQLPWINSSQAIQIEYKAEHSEKGIAATKYYPAMGRYELAALKQYLQQFFEGELNWKMLREAIIYAAQQNKTNIYQDYFRYGLPEDDGIDRFDFLYRYAGVKNREWAIIVARVILLAMIARCFEPGYDYRGIVVFEGGQDIGKSRLCRVFAFHENFYTQFTFDKNNHGYEVTRQLEGMAVVEFPDMGGINSRDTNYIKAFFTATHDRNRRMNQDLVEHLKRCGVHIITTNYSEPYFTDQTGNSRYVVCPCETNHIDIEAIEREMPMLLAQAYSMWKAGATPRLTDEEKKLQIEYLKPREVVSDYYYWLLPHIKLHRDEFKRNYEWDDGATLEEIVKWCENDEWFPSKPRHRHKGHISAVLEKHYNIKSIVRGKRIDSETVVNTRKYRYFGEQLWDDFVDGLE